MQSAVEVRRALPSDADDISRGIIRALRETNGRDYPAHVITAVAESFSPARVAEKLAARRAYVAVADGVIVGTASLEGCIIRGVYVDPTCQGKGIGGRLMDVLEGFARDQAGSTLVVPSSIAAEGFYRRRGFVCFRDEFHGNERTIIMKKEIGQAPRSG
jgi:GNAT superfamily N-acetyltransferase